MKDLSPLSLIQKTRSDCRRFLPLSQVKKFLIIRFSSIGDIVLTSPVIRCLKEQTGAEIHYITKQSYASILENNPYVDRVFAFENEITEVVEELKKEQYDFVVDLHNNIRSVRLKKLLKRPSAAFPKLNRQKFFLTSLKWNMMPDLHVVDRYFIAVKSLGVVPDNLGLEYYIPEEKHVDLAAYNILKPFVAFAIGAKFATKRLPNDKIIEILKGIDQTVVLLGGPEDKENADIIQNAGDHVHSLVGQLDLDESASVVQQSQLLITHDTGLMHIGAALNKKIVSVWGNTVPDLGMYPYMPQNKKAYSIHEVDLKCRPCSKIGYQQCPKSHFKCMNEQNVATILAAVHQRL